MIGIFDSGSGGLTVLKAIRDVLPSADILYYGDIQNAPYGSKSREELSVLTVRALEFLQQNGADSIVSACNSVSASLAISLFDAFSITPKHLIEMVGPTVSCFRDSDARILLVATPATIRAELYQSAFRMIGKDVTTIAIDDLAEAIELGTLDAEIEAIIASALPTFVVEKHDILILACTHYPLVMDSIRRVVGERLAIFDPAVAVASRVETRLWPREVGNGATKFVITQDSAVFRNLVAELLLRNTYEIEVAARTGDDFLSTNPKD